MIGMHVRLWPVARKQQPRSDRGPPCLGRKLKVPVLAEYAYNAQFFGTPQREARCSKGPSAHVVGLETLESRVAG